MKIPIFEHVSIKPLEKLGLTGSFWDIHIDTLLFTWIAMGILFFVVILARYCFINKKTNPFSVAIEQITEFFTKLCKDSFGSFKYEYFSFIYSLFIFILFCNASGMLPFVKEPTEDINTALACGICSFLYVQYQKIKTNGLIGYLKEYLEPFPFLFPITIPLSVVGELAKIASMSFRLFGNILGGSIIIVIALQSVKPFRIHFMLYAIIALPIVMLLQKLTKTKDVSFIKKIISINNLIIFTGAWLLMFFGLFEGIVQAFVITMLTVTYLSLGGNKENANA